MSSTCVSCNKKISRANDGFDCGMCQGMLHLKCEGINLLAKEYQKLSPAQRRMWLCRSCNLRRNKQPREDGLATPTVRLYREYHSEPRHLPLCRIESLLRTAQDLCAGLRKDVDELREENTALKERICALEDGRAISTPSEPPCDLEDSNVYPAGSLYGESIGFTMENLAVFMEILNENFMEKTMESVKQVFAISPCISPWISLWRYRYILASYGEN
ncbi:hypothetical protein DMENIID0001_169880 [Sergentomyia squamirostris]